MAIIDRLRKFKHYLVGREIKPVVWDAEIFPRYVSGSIEKRAMDWFAARNVGDNVGDALFDYNMSLLRIDEQICTACMSDKNVQSSSHDLSEAFKTRSEAVKPRTDGGMQGSQDLLMRNIAVRDAAIAYVRATLTFFEEHKVEAAQNRALETLKILELPIRDLTAIIPPRAVSGLKIG